MTTEQKIIYMPANSEVSVNGKVYPATYDTKQIRASLETLMEDVDISNTHTVAVIPSQFYGEVGKIFLKKKDGFTIEEKNKVIAEFDGIKHIDKKTYEHWWYEFNDGKSAYAMQFKYHSSWNWLMPIVEKIEGIRHDVYHRFNIVIYGIRCRIESKYFHCNICKQIKIAAVHEAVFQFCQWYLSQKNFVS